MTARGTEAAAVPVPKIRSFRLTKWDGDPPTEGEQKVPFEVIEGQVNDANEVVSVRVLRRVGNELKEIKE